MELVLILGFGVFRKVLFFFIVCDFGHELEERRAILCSVVPSF